MVVIVKVMSYFSFSSASLRSSKRAKDRPTLPKPIRAKLKWVIFPPGGELYSGGQGYGLRSGPGSGPPDIQQQRVRAASALTPGAEMFAQLATNGDVCFRVKSMRLGGRVLRRLQWVSNFSRVVSNPADGLTENPRSRAQLIFGMK
jgi:hypothetical protein